MGNLYSMLVPVLLAAIGIAAVSTSISGDEHDGRLEMLFAFAISRPTILLGRLSAAVLSVALSALAVLASVVLGRLFFELDVSWDGLVAITLVMVLFAVFHLCLAYVLAACGTSSAVSFAVPFAVLVGGYVLRSLVPLIDGAQDLANFSPWEWALAEDPLGGDVSAWRLGLLVLLSAAAVVAGTLVAKERDIHAP